MIKFKDTIEIEPELEKELKKVNTPIEIFRVINEWAQNHQYNERL